MRTAPVEDRGPERRPRAAFLRRAALLALLAFPAAAPVLQMMGCGARSEIEAPGSGSGGGGSGCTETQTAAFSAAYGGGIHHIYTECMARPDGGACPTMEEALELLVPVSCSYIEEIHCGPIEKPEQCCYIALEFCAYT